MDRCLAEEAAEKPEGQHNVELLASMPGTGSASVLTSLADLTELGRLSLRAFSALVGLAPINRETGGSWRAKRSMRSGRESVRTALYIASDTAIRCNPVKKAPTNTCCP